MLSCDQEGAKVFPLSHGPTTLFVFATSAAVVRVGSSSSLSANAYDHLRGRKAVLAATLMMPFSNLYIFPKLSNCEPVLAKSKDQEPPTKARALLLRLQMVVRSESSFQ